MKNISEIFNFIIEEKYEKVKEFKMDGADITIFKSLKGYSWDAFKNGREFACDSGHKTIESAEERARKIVKEKLKR